MLPNIRALFGAIVAAVALLMISFGVVATFRVAQDARIGMLQADLAQRSRSLIPASAEGRTTLLIDQPAPLAANPVPMVEIQEAPEIPQQAPETPMAVVLAMPEPEPPGPELPATDLAAIKMSAIEPQSAEPPMGGPLAQDTPIHSGQPARKAADAIAARNAKKKSEQAAAKKAAKKARAQRLARERKAAAGKARAAQARAKRQSARSFGNTPFGNSFGASGNSAFGNGTFGNGAFGTSASSQ